MPTPVLDGDILECRTVCATPNQIGVNVRHYKINNSAGAGVSLEACAARFDNLINNAYINLISEDATYRGVGVRRLTPNPSAETQVITNAGGGATMGDLFAKQVSGVITLKTSLPGRERRGRVYIPFPSEASNDADSTPTVQYLADLNTLGGLLIQTIVVGAGADLADMTPIVWSRKLLVGTEIVAYRANDRWGTQRRRGDYGAMNFPPF